MKEEPQNIIDSPDTRASEVSIIREMIIWWEKRRIIYNVIIIALSVFLIYDFWDYPMRHIVGGQAMIMDAIIFIFIANIFYSLSWGLGLISHFIFKTKGLSKTGRWVLFSLGTLISIITTNLYFVLAFDVLFAY